MASKIDKTDAQEWLESLSQVGEGWYRGVALAVRAGAPKALGITAREFAQQIGQKLIDPTEAILELANELKYRGKPNIKAICDVLGVSNNRVEMVLAEAGLIEVTPNRQAMIEAGTTTPGRRDGRGWSQGAQSAGSAASTPSPGETTAASTPSESEAEVEAKKQIAKLQREVNRLTKEKGDAAELERVAADLRKQLNRYRKEARDAAVKARDEAWSELTEQERTIAKKEAEAMAAEQGEKVMAGLAFLIVGQVTGALEEATEAVKVLIRDGGITKEHLKVIETAHAAFIEELNVARMSEKA